MASYLSTHGSHTHVIPANKKIMRAIKALRRNQVMMRIVALRFGFARKEMIKVKLSGRIMANFMAILS